MPDVIKISEDLSIAHLFGIEWIDMWAIVMGNKVCPIKYYAEK